MSEERKPREFRLEVHEWHTNALPWNNEELFQPLTTGEQIHVREVVEGEPDWRAMCEEFAETMKIAIDMSFVSTRANEILGKALEKYRAMKEK
jgi:hypothetical protein